MDIYELISTRRSVRSYKPDPIEEDKLNRVLEAVRLSPSAGNRQPWKFILVRDEKMRRDLAAASGGQTWVGEAPIVVVACGLPESGQIGGYTDSTLVDASIAFTHLMLAAAAEGLGTCWIGAFDNAKVKELMNIPPEVRLVGLTPLGYPTEPLELAPKRRKSLNEIVCEESYK